MSVSVLSVGYFLLNFRFSYRNPENFLILFLLFLSCITFTAMSLGTFYNHENDSNEAPEGHPGKKGQSGHDGEPAAIKNESELCAEKMEESSNNTIIKYLKKKNIYMQDKENLYFKNLYMKRKFKQICRSRQFKNRISQEGSYNAISFLIKSSQKWTEIILGYEQGLNFLNSSFWIDRKWDKLLSRIKSKNEKKSPFDIIKTDRIWGWI